MSSNSLTLQRKKPGRISSTRKQCFFSRKSMHCFQLQHFNHGLADFVIATRTNLLMALEESGMNSSILRQLGSILCKAFPPFSSLAQAGVHSLAQMPCFSPLVPWGRKLFTHHQKHDFRRTRFADESFARPEWALSDTLSRTPKLSRMKALGLSQTV